MKKKLFSLLVLTSIIMYASLSIALAVTKRTDDYVYEIKGAGIRIVQYIGSEKETLAVPGTIDNKPVTIIGENAFKEVSVDVISLPDSLLTIEENAFYKTGCKKIIQTFAES